MESCMHRCTSVATLSFSAVVLLYVGVVYNAVYLGRILPAMGKVYQVAPLAVVFNAFYVMALWSYVRAHAADPGRVPERWHDFVDRSSLTVPVFAAVPQWQPGKVTYCKNCDKTRPERAHHCFLCGHCVLRFDHHCVWINNCVGFNNHKHFLLVGIYCCLGLLVALTTSFPELVVCVVSMIRSSDGTEAVDGSGVTASEEFAFLIFGMLGAVIFALLAAMLFIHLPRATDNVTAPEAHYTNMVNPFDRGGAMANLEQIFGVYGIDWFFPVSPWRRVSDGVTFQQAGDPDWLRLDDESEAEELWRLRYDAGLPEPEKPVSACF